ncbi:RHS repeat-associated core domain-containing protein [Kaistella sp.]|uniref:RHS repeat-associated core domain-containing protein n=1 Tax=Kaistella sp. TaxID=2782235 RepID=UPI003C315146
MNHLNPSNNSVYNPLGAPYNYKYNGKELQETGMYDYGWRMYMPDIARWNGMDQLSEKFISSSPYAYVMNNPAMFFDPDGRDIDWNLIWKNATPNATTTYSNFDSSGNWGNRSFVPFAEAGTATAFYNFLAGGGTGSYTYWTGGAMSGGGYSLGSDGLRQRDIQGSVGHNINIKGSNDSFKNWADLGATTMQGMFKYAADSRTNFYNSGNWIDNLGNVRSTKYAGRAKGSLIGLRSDYIKGTAMYGKYAERAGWIGYGISAIEIGEGISKDNGTYGNNAQIATAKAVGGIIGAAEGALIGAYIGTVIIPIPGVGTAAGIVIGLGVGYIYSEIAGQMVEHIQNN